MNASDPLPLNEPQQRRLTVTLADLEQHLAELRERLEQRPADLRLTHYKDAIAPAKHRRCCRRARGGDAIAEDGR